MNYRCVDHFLLPKSCVSLAFSANGCFLVTAHVDDLGIYLWNNQSLFTQISLRAIEPDFKPKYAPLPGSAVRRSDSDTEVTEVIANDEEEFISPEQISDSLVTLSLLPDSRWKNLLSLDAIKVKLFFDLHLWCKNVSSSQFSQQRRNKPKDAPKTQKLAPFFLSNLSGAQSASEVQKITTSRVLDSSSVAFCIPMTPWATKLSSALTKDECKS